MSTTFIETVVQGSTQSDFSVPFTYITESDVKVYVDGVITTDYTFTNGSLITFTTPPTDGSTVLIRRETNATTKAVDFQSGAMLTEGDLDTGFDQVFYLSQESKDIVSSAIFKDPDGKMDAQGNIIKNVADGIADGDAINKGQLGYEYPKVETVADNISDVNAVSAISADISTVASKFLGVHATAPTTTVLGAFYHNSVTNYSYIWSGVWNILKTSFTASLTAPTNPELGDEWFDPQNGRMYKYIKDTLNNSMWLNH